MQDYDASTDPFPYKETYFVSLESQSNIYCCSKLFSADEEKLLVGTLRGNVLCIECKNSREGTRNLCANAVYFTYIPGDAEIISIDTYTRTDHGNSPRKIDTKVIAVSLALVKTSDGVKKHQHFLNIYKAMEPEERNLLKDIARGCQHIDLQFTPYQLTHSSISSDGKSRENVFLLSGSDQKIHLFKENEEQQRFEELPVEEYFPEFIALPSNVIWMDTKNCRGGIRMSAIGCQNGFIKVSVVDSNSVILKSFTMDVAGLVTSVRLFPLKRETPPMLPKGSDASFTEDKNCLDEAVSCDDLCLLVTCAFKLSVVYANVSTRGFEDMVVLPKSDHFDSITCSAIADLDLSGDNEIILGAYGQELLIYKSYRSSMQNDHVSVHFDLRWTKSFPKPIHAIQTIDLNRNGLQELAVVSLNGVHVLQYDVGKAAEKIIQGIIKLELSNETDENHKSSTNDFDHMSRVIEESSSAHLD